MEWRDLFELQHSHVHSSELGLAPFSIQDNVLEGLDVGQLRCVPRPGLNSIVWLLWHIARCEDAAVNAVIGNGEQVLDDRWRQDLRVARPDIGTGMDADEVAELSAAVDVDALLRYRLEVARRTRAVLDSIDGARLAQPSMAPSQVERLEQIGLFGANAGWVSEFWSTKPLLWFLWLPTGHCYSHLNEARTVRSLFEVAADH
jgi:hypothetical protein